MKVRFQKSKLNTNASVTLPSSKSLSHRALITASLAEGDSMIHSVSFSKDIEATMACMQCLGASFEQKGNDILVHGTGNHFRFNHQTVDCNESGSTLRFLIPIFALLDEEVTFTGHGKLMQRPQSVYADLFKEKELLFIQEEQYLKIKGPLSSGEYSVAGDVSSQFISGLLFALPLCKKDSILHITEPFESASYVELTVDALKTAGVIIHRNGNDILIPGNQKYHPIDTSVEGDASQAAFFGELAMITHQSIDVLNLRHDSKQGDAVIIQILERMGCDVTKISQGYHFQGSSAIGTEVDLADCPDLGPALFALATQAEGISIFHNCARLRIKESDRIACMEEELRKLGADISSDQNTVTIKGKTVLNSNTVLNGHNDHRIVMALSMLASITDNTVIEGAEAVSKSYPGFFGDLKRTGVNVYDE